MEGLKFSGSIPGFNRRVFCLSFSSLFVLKWNFIYFISTCRSLLMSLQWSAGSVVDGRRSTERWSVTLWSVLRGGTCCWTWPRPGRWWLTSGGKMTATQSLNTLGEDIKGLEDYKYLAVHIDCKLNWKTNTEAAYRKERSRLDFLRRLRSFGEQQDDGYFQAAVARTRFFAVVCWGGSIGAATPTAWTNWSERLRVLHSRHVLSLARLNSLTTHRKNYTRIDFSCLLFLDSFYVLRTFECKLQRYRKYRMIAKTYQYSLSDKCSILTLANRAHLYLPTSSLQNKHNKKQSITVNLT